jgi:hypothetical protein
MYRPFSTSSFNRVWIQITTVLGWRRRTTGGYWLGTWTAPTTPTSTTTSFTAGVDHERNIIQIEYVKSNTSNRYRFAAARDGLSSISFKLAATAETRQGFVGSLADRSRWAKGGVTAENQIRYWPANIR